jgi:MoaA/NifB/PqqE/SkfB family radical SAM enzyme
MSFNINNYINGTKAFDIARNAYAMINYCDFFEKNNRAVVPLRYFFELTHLCNLNCPYCYVAKDKKDRIKKELTTNDWLNIIKQIPFYSFVTLVGGEPLIRDDFSEILFATAKKTLGKVSVVTNGILLNDKIAEDLIKSKILLLSTSLDGWGKNHDKNRNKDLLCIYYGKS